MKSLQYLVAALLTIAGVVLLLNGPLEAQTPKAFTPTRFTVVDEGTAGKPDVVLIPGLASGRDTWDKEAALLAPNYRLHLVQLNGFAGQAAGSNASGVILPPTVDELHQYISTAGMHPAVIGHSLGGLLALMLAEKYPNDARRLVIVDALPFYALLFSPDATVEGAKPIADQIKAQMLQSSAQDYAASAPAMAPQMSNDPAGQKKIAAAMLSSDRTVVADAMAEDLTTDVRSGLPNIKVPVLVLYEHDTTLTQPNADAYEKSMKDSYAKLPGAELVKVDGSRHFIMYDKPVEFDALVEKFLK